MHMVGRLLKWIFWVRQHVERKAIGYFCMTVPLRILL